MIKVGSKVRLVQPPKSDENHHYDHWTPWFWDAAKDAPAIVTRIYTDHCNVEFIRPVITMNGTFTELHGHYLYMFEEIYQKENSSEYED